MPAKAGTQFLALGPRFRGDERISAAELSHPSRRLRRMGENKRKLDEQLDRLQEELPKPAAKPVSKLRRPDWKWVRIPAGILLVIAGVVSSTPALNSRFAAGLALLAIDVPFLRKPTARLIGWGLDKWEGLRDRFRARESG